MDGLPRYAKPNGNFRANRNKLKIPSQMIRHETVPLMPRIEANGLSEQAGADTYPNPAACSGRRIGGGIAMDDGAPPFVGGYVGLPAFSPTNHPKISRTHSGCSKVRLCSR